MEVGSANGAGGDFDDCIATIFDLGIRDAFAADVVLAMPSKRLHVFLLIGLLVERTSPFVENRHSKKMFHRLLAYSATSHVQGTKSVREHFARDERKDNMDRRVPVRNMSI
jgi:hypothetical protein